MNQIKAILARFGIRTFQPTLRKAEEKLEGLRTAEGTPLLENTRAELRRYLARLRVAREQIRAAGESLYALSKRHDISRQLIRVWVQKYESGALYR